MCTFKHPVTFERCAFGEFGDFTQSRFEAKASFAASYFDRQAEFQSCVFENNAIFDDIEFGEGNSEHGCEVNLSFARFNAPSSFANTVFSKFMPDLTSSVFHDSTRFTILSRHWPASKPDILPQISSLLGPQKEEPDEATQFHIEAKASAARLRHMMAKQALPEEEHFFFRREMHHAARSGPKWPRIPILAYEALSNFGYSISRPVLWLLGVVTIFWLVYGAQFAWDAVLHDSKHSSGEAFALSFANTFSFLGFQRLYFGVDYINTLPVWMRVFGAVQTVFGFILLFFLGLGLRTRFRLR